MASRAAVANQLRIEAAVVLVKDALAGRARPSAFRPDARALRLYQCHHAAAYRAFVTLAATAHMCLVLLEAPSGSRVVPSKPGTEPRSYLSTTLFEAVILMVYAVDIALQVRYAGVWMYLSTSWNQLEVAATALFLLDITTTALGLVGVQFSRALRPLFIITKRRHVRFLVTGVCHAIPAVAPLLLIAATALAICSFIGVLLFSASSGLITGLASDPLPFAPYCSPFVPPHEPAPGNLTALTVGPDGDIADSTEMASSTGCEDYFASFGVALYNMFNLFTKTGWPNIIIPYLERRPASALFFVIFLLGGHFFLFRVLIAVAFASFSESANKRIARRAELSKAALLRAFRLLGDPDTGFVSLEAFRALGARTSPELDAEVYDIVFRAMGGDCGLIGPKSFVAACRLLDVRSRPVPGAVRTARVLTALLTPDEPCHSTPAVATAEANHEAGSSRVGNRDDTGPEGSLNRSCVTAVEMAASDGWRAQLAAAIEDEGDDDRSAFSSDDDDDGDDGEEEEGATGLPASLVPLLSSSGRAAAVEASAPKALHARLGGVIVTGGDTPLLKSASSRLQHRSRGSSCAASCCACCGMRDGSRDNARRLADRRARRAWAKAQAAASRAQAASASASGPSIPKRHSHGRGTLAFSSRRRSSRPPRAGCLGCIKDSSDGCRRPVRLWLRSACGEALVLVLACAGALSEVVLQAARAAGISALWGASTDISTAFAVVFVVEMGVKLWANGPESYFRRGLDVLDGFVTVSAASVAIAQAAGATASCHVAAPDPESQQTCARALLAVALVRAFRVLRVLRLLRPFWRPVLALRRTGPLLLRIAVVLFIVMYSIASIGMEAFAGSLSPYGPRAREVLESAYGKAGFWALNFATFEGSLLGAFWLALNTKAPILYEGIMAAEAAWLPMIFFVLVYGTLLLAFLPVVQAFVIRGFQAQLGLIARRDEGFVEAWEHLTAAAQVRMWRERPLHYGAPLRRVLALPERFGRVGEVVFGASLMLQFENQHSLELVPEAVDAVCQAEDEAVAAGLAAGSCDATQGQVSAVPTARAAARAKQKTLGIKTMSIRSDEAGFGNGLSAPERASASESEEGSGGEAGAGLYVVEDAKEVDTTVRAAGSVSLTDSALHAASLGRKHTAKDFGGAALLSPLGGMAEGKSKAPGFAGFFGRGVSPASGAPATRSQWQGQGTATAVAAQPAFSGLGCDEAIAAEFERRDSERRRAHLASALAASGWKGASRSGADTEASGGDRGEAGAAPVAAFRAARPPAQAVRVRRSVLSFVRSPLLSPPRGATAGDTSGVASQAFQERGCTLATGLAQVAPHTSSNPSDHQAGLVDWMVWCIAVVCCTCCAGGRSHSERCAEAATAERSQGEGLPSGEALPSGSSDSCRTSASRACQRQCSRWCLEELRLRRAPTVRTSSKAVNVAVIHRIARLQRDDGHPQSTKAAQQCAAAVFRPSFGGSPAGLSSWLDRPEHSFGQSSESDWAPSHAEGNVSHLKDMASASRLLVRGCEDRCFFPAFDSAWSAIACLFGWCPRSVCGLARNITPPPQQLIPGFGISRLVGLARFLRHSLPVRKHGAASPVE